MEKFINSFRSSKKSYSLSKIQKSQIIDRLEQVEAIYYLIGDEMRFLYQEIIKQIKTTPNLTRSGILDLKGICPSIFFEIDSVLKGEPSLNLDLLLARPDFLQIKTRFKKIEKYLR